MLATHCLNSRPFTAQLSTRSSAASSRFLDVPPLFRQQPKQASRQAKSFNRCVCSASESSQPEKAAGAIALGLKAYEKEDYNEAIGLFKEALTLPGSGIKQYRDKPAIASDGEKISAYYNIACCLSRTGNTHDGLLALLEALQMGYEDFQQIRTDPDLAGLRADSKFEPLIGRFQKTNRKNVISDFLSNIKNPLQR